MGRRAAILFWELLCSQRSRSLRHSCGSAVLMPLTSGQELLEPHLTEESLEKASRFGDVVLPSTTTFSLPKALVGLKVTRTPEGVLQTKQRGEIST